MADAFSPVTGSQTMSNDRTSARQLTLNLLNESSRSDRFADVLLSRALDNSSLDARDKSLTAELFLGVIRRLLPHSIVGCGALFNVEGQGEIADRLQGRCWGEPTTSFVNEVCDPSQNPLCGEQPFVLHVVILSVCVQELLVPRPHPPVFEGGLRLPGSEERSELFCGGSISLPID